MRKVIYSVILTLALFISLFVYVENDITFDLTHVDIQMDPLRLAHEKDPDGWINDRLQEGEVLDLGPSIEYPVGSSSYSYESLPHCQGREILVYG